MAKKFEDLKTPPSDEFMRVVCNMGSPVTDCDFCGRTHFATGENNCMDEGELDHYWKYHKKEPDRWIPHDYDGISSGELDGKRYVWGCPCNAAYKYEAWIWHNRQMIADYITARAKRMLDDAVRADKAAVTLAQGISTVDKISLEQRAADKLDLPVPPTL